LVLSSSKSVVAPTRLRINRCGGAVGTDAGARLPADRQRRRRHCP
jgi:hypothetical protein